MDTATAEAVAAAAAAAELEALREGLGLPPDPPHPPPPPPPAEKVLEILMRDPQYVLGGTVHELVAKSGSAFWGMRQGVSDQVHPMLSSIEHTAQH